MEVEKLEHGSQGPTSNDTIQQPDSNSFDDDGRSRRTGNVWTSIFRMINAFIGPALLTLPWAFAQLGWFTGPASLIGFSVLTYHCSVLQAYCYRTGDQLTGQRNYTYMEAVTSHLGGMKAKFCAWVQYLDLFARPIGYTIAASTSIMAVTRSECYHNSGGNHPCQISKFYMILFGIVQIIMLSPIPDFNENQLWWVSGLLSFISYIYSIIGLRLGIAKVIENKQVKGSLTGLSTGNSTLSQSLIKKSQACGNVAFAFSHTMILIKIQDTIKSPPEESKTMLKAILGSSSVTMFFFQLFAGSGYAAFGDESPRNVLTGFGQYWLPDIANYLVVFYLIGAYLNDCQSLFPLIEKNIAQKLSDSDFMTKEFEVPILGCKSLKLNLFRLLSRAIFVICCTFIAMVLPFFNEIVGLIGVLEYWPFTVYFPVEMYIVQTKIPKWSTEWICLRIFSAASGILTIVAVAGSFAGLLQDFKGCKS